MQLLIQRGQRMIIIFPVFDLWAKFELNSEEDALIAKYRVRKHILVQGKPLQRLWAGALGIIIAGVIAAIIHNFFGAGLITFLVFVGSTLLLYHQFREEVRVSDILDGRHFICRTVVKLIVKEQEIAEMAHAFRHLLEAMKNWGGREIIELKPYKEPVLRMIEPLQTDVTHREAWKGLTLSWLSGFGIITGIAGIGGYLYLSRVSVTSKVMQEPNFTQSNLSTAKSSVPQKIPWKENLQEEDITQVLSLAEEKLLEVKRQAENSLPPKQGNRKLARAANGQGLAYLKSGQLVEAARAFQEGRLANPADVEIVNNLGYAYLLDNDPVSAEAYMFIALGMQPNRSAAWGNLGQAYVKKGQMADAVSSFTNAYRFSRDLNQTHSYFLVMMEKENDVNLKQALRQATQVGKKWYMKK
jgi:tetratricopeptide (TPR) repeat protein